ncbi:MAG: hypothetical protein AMXMBFR84_03420 [Candidatus Hydrogenedentota bacterium]
MGCGVNWPFTACNNRPSKAPPLHVSKATDTSGASAFFVDATAFEWVAFITYGLFHDAFAARKKGALRLWR